MTNQLKVITDRKEMAHALSSGEYKVLSYDMDNNVGSYVGVKYEAGYTSMTSVGRLKKDYYKKDDGVFYVSNPGTIITARTDVFDWIERVKKTNAPILKVGETVAILCYIEDANLSFVRLVTVKSINPGCSNLVMFG